jgi:hypothetical protein
MDTSYWRCITTGYTGEALSFEESEPGDLAF